MGGLSLRLAGALAVLILAGCASEPPAEPSRFLIFFRADEATLTADAREIVATIGTAWRQRHPAKVVVAGNADGATAHDATLADERAATVVRALVEAGIDANAIEKEPSAPPPGRTGYGAHQVGVEFRP